MGRFILASTIIAIFMGAVSVPALSLALTPAVQLAPGYIRLTITITPNNDNREICFGYADEDVPVRVSCQSLEGDKAPKRIIQSYEGITSGEYQAFAQLFYSNSRPGPKTVTTFQVN